MLSSLILLRSNSPAGLVFWAVIGLCAGIYLFIHGFKLLQRRRLILDTPFSKIRSASLGMVELSGLAVGPHTLVAPITARDCYYYRTVAWEWKRQGKSSQWVKLASESMHVPFFLDDNTGKLLIDPRGADLDLHRDFQQEFCDGFFTTKQPAPANVRDFLARHAVTTSNKIKIEEFCIKPKNSLFVLGTLDENPGIELTGQPIADEDHHSFSLTRGGISVNVNVSGLSGFSLGSLNRENDLDDRLAASIAASPAVFNRATQVIRLSPDTATPTAAEMTQQQKIAAALMKAGISSPAAWAAAGVTPSDVAGSASATGIANGSNGSSEHASNQPSPQQQGTSTVQAPAPSDGFDPHPSVVLMKGNNNPTFVISWRSQRDLANSLGWKCTLMIWGGPALALLSLYALLNIAHLM